MKKLLLILGLLIPALAFSQTVTPVTPQFQRKLPADSLLGYKIPGVTGTHWVPDTAWLNHHNVSYFNHQHSGDGSAGSPIGIKDDTLTEFNKIWLLNDSGNFAHSNYFYWQNSVSRFQVVAPINLASSVYLGFTPDKTDGDSSLFIHNGQIVRGTALDTATNNNIYHNDGTIPVGITRTVGITSGATLDINGDDGTNFSHATFKPQSIKLNVFNGGTPTGVWFDGSISSLYAGAGAPNDNSTSILLLDGFGSTVRDDSGGIGIKGFDDYTTNAKTTDLAYLQTKGVKQLIADSLAGHITANIGNSDLTLTGDRILKSNGNSFKINNVSGNDSTFYQQFSSGGVVGYENKSTGKFGGVGYSGVQAYIGANSNNEGSNTGGLITVTESGGVYTSTMRVNTLAGKIAKIEVKSNTGIFTIYDPISHKGFHADSLSIYPLKLTSPWDYLPRKVTDSLYAHSGSAFTLTTTGSSGASTYSGGTLNIPTYTLTGLGGVPTTRNVNTGTGLTGGGSLASDLTLKPDTSILQTVANFFPKADTRYTKSSVTPRTHMIAFMGNSMTAADIFPAQVISNLGVGWKEANFGISGDNTQGMVNRFTAVTTGNPEYVVILGGVNDLTGGVYTTSQTIANLQAMATAAHNAGAKVIMLTVLPFGSNSGWNSTIETNRNTVNTAIKTTIINVDYAIDMDPVMWDPAHHANLNPTYDSGDGKHPNTLGYQTMGNTITSTATFTQSSSTVSLSLAKNSTIDQDLATSANVFHKGVTTTNLTVINDIAGSIPAPVASWAYVQLMPATQGARAFDGTNNLPAYADGSTWHHMGLTEVTNASNTTTNAINTGIITAGGTAGNTGGIINNVAMSGATSVYGYNEGSTIGATATTGVVYHSGVSIAASSPIVNLFHFRVDDGTFSSTPTTEYGYYFPNSTGATNTKAFDGEEASGSGRYNLYMGGTAQNFFNGNLILNNLTASKPLFLDASKNITNTGPGTSSQLIGADGSTITPSTLTLGRGLTGTSFSVLANTTATLDTTQNYTWSKVQTITANGIGATPTDRFILSNSNAATNGAQQISPDVKYIGSGFASTGSTSQTDYVTTYMVPIQGTTNSSAAFNIDFSINGGAANTKLQVFSSGTMTVGGGTGSVNAGLYTGNVSSFATTLTDALVTLNSTAATSGVPLQNSGNVRVGGKLWNTGGTPASNQFDWITYATGASGSSPTTTLTIASSLVTGTTPSYTTRATLDNSGTFTVTNINANGGYLIGGTTNANLDNPNAFTGFSTAVSADQYGGSTTNWIRTLFGAGQTTTTAAGASSYSAAMVPTQSFTTPASGAIGNVTSLVIKPAIVVNGGITPINAQAGMSFPAAGATNNFNWWFNGGITRASQFQVDTLTASMGVGTDANKRLVSINVPVTQGTADLTAQSSTGNITTFTVGSSTATFNISAYLNVTAISVDNVQVQITYTDENNTAQTYSYTALTAIGNSSYNPVTIRAKNGTTITVKTNNTVGGGTETFDAGARITQL